MAAVEEMGESRYEDGAGRCHQDVTDPATPQLDRPDRRQASPQ